MDDQSQITSSAVEAVDGTSARAATTRLFALALGGTLLLAASVLLVLALVLRDDSAPTAEAALPFDLPGLDGGRLTQAAFAGRVVVVNVWASWCGPCQEEAPVLERMAGRPSAASFFGIVRLDDPEAALAFAKEHGLDYPHAVDDGTFTQSHNVTVLPTTLVFAADGSFVGRIEGAVSEARLGALIEDAVALGPPARSGRAGEAPAATR
ncbi:MAG: TlpA family protein disulfide reductase [Dehalococcoidia bacterium]|nr:MAG: TlpA family protein disulfide reductase [Dehalococcoidia bacterium]